MRIITALTEYRKALEQWKSHGGLQGQGGNKSTWSPEGIQAYDVALEPQAKQFGLEGSEWAVKIRKDVLGL